MQEQDRIIRSFPEVAKRVRHRGPFRQRHRQCAARYVRHHHHAEAPGEVATGHDLRKADSRKWTRSCSSLVSPIRGPCRLRTGSTWNSRASRPRLASRSKGPDLAHIEDIGARMQQILTAMPETSSVFAERVSQGFYLNVEVNRPEAARYGLTLETCSGSSPPTSAAQTLRRMSKAASAFPSMSAMSADFRGDPEALGRAL